MARRSIVPNPSSGAASLCRFSSLLLLLSVLALTALPAPWLGGGIVRAEEAGQFWTMWTVQSVTGQVEQQTASSPERRNLRPGDVLGDNTLVHSGADGTAVLVKGKDRITVHPASAIELLPPETDVFTRAVQRIGRIAFEVETRPSRTFEVDTPYLAAVVKGTRFTVSVSAAGAQVDVTRGTVMVSEPRSGTETAVRAGETAAVSASGSAGIKVDRPGSAVGRAEPAARRAASSVRNGGLGTGPSDGVGGAGSSGATLSGSANRSGDRSGGESGGVGSGGSGNDGGSAHLGSGGATGVTGSSDRLSDRTSRGGREAGGMIGNVGGRVGDSVGGDVGGAVGDAADAVGGAVGGVGDAVGGALGGLGL